MAGKLLLTIRNNRENRRMFMADGIFKPNDNPLPNRGDMGLTAVQLIETKRAGEELPITTANIATLIVNGK
jgi:hypothetical protein